MKLRIPYFTVFMKPGRHSLLMCDSLARNCATMIRSGATIADAKESAIESHMWHEFYRFWLGFTSLSYSNAFDL